MGLFGSAPVKVLTHVWEVPCWAFKPKINRICTAADPPSCILFHTSLPLSTLPFPYTTLKYFTCSFASCGIMCWQNPFLSLLFALRVLQACLLRTRTCVIFRVWQGGDICPRYNSKEGARYGLTHILPMVHFHTKINGVFLHQFQGISSKKANFCRKNRVFPYIWNRGIANVQQ